MKGWGYYLSNVLAALSYLVIRQQLPYIFDADYSRVSSAEELFAWESHTVVTWLAIVGVRVFKSRSNESALSGIFFYSKAVVFALLFTGDTRLCILYTLMCFVIFLLFPAPFFDDTAKLEFLTPENFLESVIQGKDSTWLIFFYASFSLESACMSRSIAELADKYATDRLHFGKVDVGAWPAVAQSLNIEPQTQLPTLVLFENGKEHSRLPRSGAEKNVFTKTTAAAFFELDWRHSSSRLASNTGSGRNS